MLRIDRFHQHAQFPSIHFTILYNILRYKDGLHNFYFITFSQSHLCSFHVHKIIETVEF